MHAPRHLLEISMVAIVNLFSPRRRSHRRIPLDVAVALVHECGTVGTGIALNISVTGIQVQCDQLTLDSLYRSDCQFNWTTRRWTRIWFCLYLVPQQKLMRVASWLLANRLLITPMFWGWSSVTYWKAHGRWCSGLSNNAIKSRWTDFHHGRNDG